MKINTSRTVRDGRNSRKRIEQAKASVEAARRQTEYRMTSNAWDVFRAIESANVINGGKYGQILPGYNNLRGFNLVELACEITNLSKKELSCEDIIKSRLEILWERAKYHCHDKCKSCFMENGCFTYKNLYNPNDPIRCIVCSAGLGCEHKFSELTAQQAGKIGVKHYGNCYHVYECQECGEIKTVDSSD